MSFKQVLFVSLLVVAAAEIDQSEGLEISGRQLKTVISEDFVFQIPSPSPFSFFTLDPIPIYPAAFLQDFEDFEPSESSSVLSALFTELRVNELFTQFGNGDIGLVELSSELSELESQFGDSSWLGALESAGDGTLPWVGDGTLPWVGDGTLPWVGDGTLPWVGDGTLPQVGDPNINFDFQNSKQSALSGFLEKFGLDVTDKGVSFVIPF